MNMAGAALNPAAGGPVGGGMIMMNNNGNGPVVPMNSERNPEQIKIMLNTYVYEYFVKLRYFDIARALVKDDKFEFRTNSSKSPGHRKDGEVNGADGDSMDTDVKDDIPDDLPRPASAADPTMQGNGFLFEWFSVFSDLFAAHRNSHKPGNPTPAMQYLNQHQQLQRMRELQQNQNLARPGGMMNPNFMRNNQMRNGMVNGEMQKRLTPQQLQILQQQGKAQQMQQQMPRGDQPEGESGARPATPADGENGGSPSKKPRLDGNQPFNATMMPNGRPGMPGVAQQGMMIQAGFNPNNMNQAQFRQNGGMPPKVMAANMANGMMSMPNAGSPMMQNMTQFPDGASMEVYNNRMVNQAMQGVPNGQSGNHALQDYQMQLMLLEQQNKKRLMMARQEQHESSNPRDGQPMAGGVNMQPPGMSPSGSRTGTSPNPTDQMKRTPQLGGMPGSPSAGDMQGRSPAPMNFMNGIPQTDFNQTMFMKDGQMMVPGGPNMRPPTSMDMNPMNRPPPQQPQQPQQPGRMQFAGGQPMQQQQSQGQGQPIGTPGQRNEMPPPQAPAVNSAQRGNQPASPANSNAPPTPSQSNKPNPKTKKGANKEAPDRKRPAKKNSTANAPNSEDNPPATPTASTPITPIHANQFNNSGGKGGAQVGQPPNQQPQQNQGLPQPQQQMSAPDLQPNGFPDFSAQDANFSLDFNTLENSDVLENFDFDSFLNTSNDDGPFNFDGGMVDGFGMDPSEG